MQELQIKWPRIVEELNKFYFNYIDLANVTMYRMGMRKLYNGLFVAIERKGAFLFADNQKLHKDYVGEKLNLYGSDAANIADFLNTQLRIESPNQGEYYESNIGALENEAQLNPCQIMPWHPIIIE